MTAEPGAVPLTGGVALLERAISYALGSLRLVTPAALSSPTPCREWALRDLLAHFRDSLAALREAADSGQVDLDPPGSAPDDDPVTAVRDAARHLLAAWSGAGDGAPVLIAGCPLAAGMVTNAGAIEVAVHGWDVAQACGQDRQIPPALADEMLHVAPMFADDADRPARFAAPVTLPYAASPGDRLVAFLGRRP
ncbi:MAG: TIGR03086 family metal-binding protein [Actinocatenispora sp.]